jgi:hypothetical protein
VNSLFGARVVELLRVEMASELTKFSKVRRWGGANVCGKTRFIQDTLTGHFGAEAAEWLFDIARGIDRRDVRGMMFIDSHNHINAVSDRSVVKSITAHKQFSSTNKASSTVRAIVDNIANELQDVCVCVCVTGFYRC